ncbi:hypothetical protein [Cytobacillus kochii]|uniref:hypothetical protein n=1 Tax=Cytobacillus kochii TaxID=859143 RepID=UPI0012FD823E|nr:hypothetical protein [Cytobacillus kochii]MCM3324788.1 hypothetical protein [Cytobacillus kochii]MCM3347181.1 hypothetical protein [Cytobacillus kochii]MDQ0186662.1 putative membrane protein YccC [Cytobacillus kochii]
MKKYIGIILGYIIGFLLLFLFDVEISKNTVIVVLVVSIIGLGLGEVVGRMGKK